MSLAKLSIALNVKYAEAFSPPLDKKSIPSFNSHLENRRRTTQFKVFAHEFGFYQIIGFLPAEEIYVK